MFPTNSTLLLSCWQGSSDPWPSIRKYQEFNRNSTSELPLNTRADQLLTTLSKSNSKPQGYCAPSSKWSVNLFYFKMPFAVEAHDQSQQHFQCRYNDGFYCSGLNTAFIGTGLSDWFGLGCPTDSLGSHTRHKSSRSAEFQVPRR